MGCCHLKAFILKLCFTSSRFSGEWHLISFNSISSFCDTICERGQVRSKDDVVRKIFMASFTKVLTSWKNISMFETVARYTRTFKTRADESSGYYMENMKYDTVVSCLHEITESINTETVLKLPKTRSTHRVNWLWRSSEHLCWLSICFMNRCLSLITEIPLICASLVDAFHGRASSRGAQIAISDS